MTGLLRGLDESPTSVSMRQAIFFIVIALICYTIMNQLIRTKIRESAWTLVLCSYGPHSSGLHSSGLYRPRAWYYVVMAEIGTTYIGTAHIGMAFIGMACIGMAYIGLGPGTM